MGLFGMGPERLNMSYLCFFLLTVIGCRRWHTSCACTSWRSCVHFSSVCISQRPCVHLSCVSTFQRPCVHLSCVCTSQEPCVHLSCVSTFQRPCVHLSCVYTSQGPCVTLWVLSAHLCLTENSALTASRLRMLLTRSWRNSSVWISSRSRKSGQLIPFVLVL